MTEHTAPKLNDAGFPVLTQAEQDNTTAAEWAAAQELAAANNGRLTDDPAPFDPWATRAALLALNEQVTAAWRSLSTENAAHGRTTGDPAWLREDALWTLMDAINAASTAAHLAYAVDRTLNGPTR
jgi:hypothetical protein